MVDRRIIRLEAAVEEWPLKAPFNITGYSFATAQVLVIHLRCDGHVGRGEAAGVYYRGDTPERMMRQTLSIRDQIESGADRLALRQMLPPGGARNAVDAALWDLRAKMEGRSVWSLAGLQAPTPVLTTFTCGADAPEVMAKTAREYEGARAIKLKLTGDAVDADRVCAVREALPHVWLGVDANQGLTIERLDKLMPTLEAARVSLIEQPLPIGFEQQLEGYGSPIPLAADESAQTLDDVPGLSGRFDVVNIKLDKCGGLTEGLEIAKAAAALGLKPMVGNMIGTSLAMAPAFLLSQLCEIVDLDGPIFLTRDRTPSLRYSEGRVTCPATLWG